MTFGLMARTQEQCYTLPVGFRSPPGLPSPSESSAAKHPIFLKIVSEAKDDDCESMLSTRPGSEDGYSSSASIDESEEYFARVDCPAPRGPTFEDQGYEPGRILQSTAAAMNCSDSQSLDCVLASSSEISVSVPLPPTSSLPSIGSAGHHMGMCEPCDFVGRYGDGCHAGVACKFCHLCVCTSKDVRRRKRERRQAARAGLLPARVPPTPHA